MAFKIFVSHISAEANVALALKEAIEKCFLRAVHVFVSSGESDLPAGADWFQTITDALRSADGVILLLTPESIRRPWVNFEAGAAWFSGKPILPLCAGGLGVDDLQPPYSHRQAIELRDQAGVIRLLRAIASWADLDAPKDCSCQILLSASASLEVAREPIQTAQPGQLDGNVTPLLPDLPSSELFGNRLSEAFPGERTIVKVTDSELALARLGVLLRPPLHKERSAEKGSAVLRWVRGMDWDYIESFELLGRDRCLLNNRELIVEQVVGVRSYLGPKWDFVYVETKADVPSGAYSYADGEINEMLRNSQAKKFRHYVSERYALWHGKPINIDQWNDGAIVENGIPVLVDDGESRERFLTPYNFAICSNVHVLHDSEAEPYLDRLFDRILSQSATIEELAAFVATLSKPDAWDEVAPRSI